MQRLARRAESAATAVWAGTLVVFAAAAALTAAARLPAPYVAAGAAGAAAALVVAGIRLHLPHGREWLRWRREPWLHIGTAAAVLAAAELIVALDDGPAVATAAGIVRAAGSLVAMWGVARLVNERVRGGGADVVFDAAIAACLLGVFGWLVWIDPLVARHRLEALPSVAAVVATTAALTVAGIAGKLAAAPQPRLPGFRLLFAGTGALAASELAGLLAAAVDSGFADRSAISMRVAGVGLIAAAALHPSLRRRTDPAPASPPLRRHQIVALLASVMAGPLALTVGDVVGRPPRLVPVALSSVVLGVLAIASLLHALRRRMNDAELALHDGITALPNRVLFTDRTAGALAEADRTNSGAAVVALNLDRFKTINDSLGRGGGDAVLRAVGARLRGATPSSATVGRLGGDEFGIVLPGVVDARVGTDVAQRVLEAVREPIAVGKHDVFVVASVGVALYPSDGERADALLRNADAAARHAKDLGGNRCVRYSAELNARASERLELESGLHTAIGAGELCLYYQPKVSLRTGHIVGMEALVRWNHPTLGIVPPDEFIPLAEANGMIADVGAWALEEACRQTHEWVEGGFPRLTVSVNLSARQFQLGGVEEVVERALAGSGLDPILLELELTESLALHDPDATRESLERLKDVGVVCSVDDFGTGYSGLQYLTRFPIDKLKIDKAFVRRIEESNDDARLVAGVIALAHGLDMEVVAEGVETEPQLRFLEEHGCDTVQGYYYSPPVPASEFERLLLIRHATVPTRVRRRRVEVG